MSIDDISAFVEGLGGVLTLAPGPGDGSPEISWGDRFFYYAADGVVPKGQPFATVVTKDYPGDEESRLDRPGAFRVNVSADADTFRHWTGHGRRDQGDVDVDPSEEDTVFAHPVYGSLGWLAVVNPGPRTQSAVEELLTRAHSAARDRRQRGIDAREQG